MEMMQSFPALSLHLRYRVIAIFRDTGFLVLPAWAVDAGRLPDFFGDSASLGM